MYELAKINLCNMLCDNSCISGPPQTHMVRGRHPKKQFRICTEHPTIVQFGGVCEPSRRGLLKIQDPYCLVTRTRNEALAIRGECDGVDWGVLFKGARNNEACLGITDPYCLVIRTRHDALSIGGECDGTDAIAVLLKGARNDGACLGIPDPDRLVTRTRHDTLAIRGECDRADPTAVPFQGARNDGACLGIPNPDRLVTRTRPDTLAIRGECDGADRGGVFHKSIHRGRPIHCFTSPDGEHS